MIKSFVIETKVYQHNEILRSSISIYRNMEERIQHVPSKNITGTA